MFFFMGVRLRDQGAEDNIWTHEGGSDRKMEKTT
jgi:hypothetical protein